MNSIILPTYCPTPEVAEKLGACLDAIHKYTVLDYKLVVVEQGRQYSLERDMLRKFKAWLRLGFNDPIGYAKAVNVGVIEADVLSEYLLIVNNDIVVGPGWDKQLIDAYKGREHMGLLSACDILAMAYMPGIQDFCSWWSCVCISRAVWGTVGFLDDEKLNYRMHDQDWSIRAHQKHLMVGRLPACQVLHDESSTYRHMKVDEGPERAEMRQRYGVEHYYEYVSQHPWPVR